MGKKIFVSVLIALLTFAAVWGTYVAVLSAGVRSRGEPPYALSVTIALAVQLVIYKVVRLFMKGIRRWLSCTVAVLLPMLIVMIAFRNAENFKILGTGYNAYLLGGMLGFSFVAGFKLIVAALMPERVRPDPVDIEADTPDPPAADEKDTKAEKTAE